MRKPEFFIIGAPKCGTTTLCSYLSEHPEIYFSEPKEPHFFNDDFENRYTKDLDVYLNLFAAANKKHRAVGEGSVLYLMSKTAIKNILAYNPDARFVVMFRNPLEMAPAWHSQAVYSFNEDERDFSKAWKLQDSRRAGKYLPRDAVDKKIYLYGDVCSIGTQFERTRKIIGDDRVLPILLDDFAVDTQATYSTVLDFLGVHDYDISPRRENENKQLRSWGVEKGLRIGSNLKRRMGIKAPMGVRPLIRFFNTKRNPRQPLSSEMKNLLRDFFSEEVRLLSDALGRDLTPWLDGKPIINDSIKCENGQR